jgi:hypothetical protein
MSHHCSGPDGFPHNDLLTVFPYVGPPHKARSAELVAA